MILQVFRRYKTATTVAMAISLSFIAIASAQDKSSGSVIQLPSAGGNGSG